MLIVKVYFKYFINLRNFNVYTILYLLKYDELFLRGNLGVLLAFSFNWKMKSVSTYTMPVSI